MPNSTMEGAAAPGSEQSPFAASPVEAVEAIVLMAQRLTQDLLRAEPIASRGLSLDGVTYLLAASQSEVRLARLGRLAAVAGDIRAARRELVSAGLLSQAKGADGKLEFTLTETGAELAAAVRAEFARVAAALDTKNAERLPRVLLTLRAVGNAFAPPRERVEGEAGAAG